MILHFFNDSWRKKTVKSTRNSFIEWGPIQVVLMGFLVEKMISIWLSSSNWVLCVLVIVILCKQNWFFNLLTYLIISMIFENKLMEELYWIHYRKFAWYWRQFHFSFQNSVFKTRAISVRSFMDAYRNDIYSQLKSNPWLRETFCDHFSRRSHMPFEILRLKKSCYKIMYGRYLSKNNDGWFLSFN